MLSAVRSTWATFNVMGVITAAHGNAPLSAVLQINIEKQRWAKAKDPSELQTALSRFQPRHVFEALEILNRPAKPGL